MINLKVGSVRQEGDEVRHLNVAGVDWQETGFGREVAVNKPAKVGLWQPIQLLGHAILASDLMVAEFRRP